MSTERTDAPTAFRTPPRILIPKLVRSRDAWKDKATRRKRQNKALQIRVRDLTASRLGHRRRADQLAGQVEQLRLQLEHTQQQLGQAQREREALQARLSAAGATAGPAAAPAPAPKKTTQARR